MHRTGKQLISVFVIGLFLATGFVYSQDKSSCNLSDEETFREDLIELGDLACDDFLDCVLILNFPTDYEGRKFKKISLLAEEDNHGFMPDLLTTKVKDHLSSHIYGSQDFLTSLNFKILFEPINGCSIWSTLILE